MGVGEVHSITGPHLALGTQGGPDGTFLPTLLSFSAQGGVGRSTGLPGTYRSGTSELIRNETSG